jgi:hypothetical protein
MLSLKMYSPSQVDSESYVNSIQDRTAGEYDVDSIFEANFERESQLLVFRNP